MIFSASCSVGAGFSINLQFSERICNWLLGLSVIGVAVLGLFYESPEFRFSPVRCTISLLNFVVGAFVLVRMPVKQHGSVRMIAVALPSLLVTGVAFKLAPKPHRWLLHTEILFIAGGLIAMVSFVFLHKSFAILPALRDIVVKGPYRLVRHPAYLGELMMVGACAMSLSTWLSTLPFVVGIPLVVIRILAEEKLLPTDVCYSKYKKIVRFRLLPFVW